MTNDALSNSSIVNRQTSILATAFHTFGAQHLATLVVIIALCVFLFEVAKSRAPSTRKWLGRILGAALLSYAACLYVQQGLAHALSLEYSLPLDLCNLVLIACVISLFWPNRYTTEIACFWGLGGVVQATVTPDLATGFPSWDFVLFFWGHGATLLAIVFLISGRDFRPRKNSIARMMIALNIYALIVGSINAAAGWNYGYLCRKPSMPSLLDWLGAWPWYLLSLELIAFLTFLILDLFQRLLVWLREPDSVLTNTLKS
jgi:hypothetical integral membrane protein (TIGR02206 family)